MPLERTRTAWRRSRAGAGTGAGTQSRSSSVTVCRQGAKIQNTHCNASTKCGRNKEQEEHGAGSDLPASSDHRTLGFVVSVLCFLSRFSQKAVFHAKSHIVIIRSHWQRPAGSDLYVERLCLSESARGVILLPF